MSISRRFPFALLSVTLNCCWHCMIESIDKLKGSVNVCLTLLMQWGTLYNLQMLFHALGTGFGTELVSVVTSLGG